ncbi:hypothetical protein GQ457_02G008280 [Hibiscus cannabinus]
MGHGFSLLLLATPNFSYLQRQLQLNQIRCNIDDPKEGILLILSLSQQLPAAAKRQGNGTRVQMIVSDQSLGKHLLKELARLQAKLRTPESTSASCLLSLLMKKELKIQEGSNQCGPSGKRVRCLSLDNEPVPGSADAQPRNTVGRHLALGQSASMTDPLGNKEAAEAIAKMLSEVKDMQAISSVPEDRIMEQEMENKPPEDNEIAPSGSYRSPGLFKTPRKADDRQVPSREGTPSTRRTKSDDVKKMERMFKDATEENVRSIIAHVTELKERVAKLQYQKQAASGLPGAGAGRNKGGWKR